RRCEPSSASLPVPGRMREAEGSWRKTPGNGFVNGSMSLASVADADLVARCREGDQSAWAELVNRFSRYVYAISIRVYRLQQPDAEDVFQEVFARTYESLGELRDDAA